MAVDAVAQPTPRFRLMLASRWSWLPGNVTLILGGAIVGGIILLSLLAPWITPYDPIKPDYGAALLPPGPGHLLGTDNFGRDVFTRILYAARIDLQLGFFSVVFAWMLGNTLGLLAGFFGGKNVCAGRAKRQLT